MSEYLIAYKIDLSGYSGEEFARLAEMLDRDLDWISSRYSHNLKVWRVFVKESCTARDIAEVLGIPVSLVSRVLP